MIKLFIYRILIFCLFPALLIALLEAGISIEKKNLFSEESLDRVFGNRAAAYAWTGKIHHPHKVLLLGSSSVKYGLSCRLLNEMFKDSLFFISLAEDARDPVETYFILKHLDLTNVKSVCIGIDPWIFTRNYYRNRDAYLLLDMNANSAFRYGMDVDARLLLKRYRKFLAYLVPTTSKKVTQFTIPAELGAGTLDKKPQNFNDPVTRKFRLNSYGWSDLQFTYLRKIRGLCESKGIVITVFYPPRRSDFRKDFEENGGKIQTSFTSQLDKIGFNDRIHELTGTGYTLPDSLFADAYHLNRNGQAVYSRLFPALMNEK